MTWLGPEQDQPIIQNEKTRKRVDKWFQVAGFIGAFAVAGFAAWTLFTAIDWENKRANVERELWGPQRVAEVYNNCLDTRLGLQPGGITGSPTSRDDGVVVRQILRDELTYEGIEHRLKDLGCEPLPQAAYDYREKYGNRILPQNEAFK